MGRSTRIAVGAVVVNGRGERMYAVARSPTDDGMIFVSPSPKGAHGRWTMEECWTPEVDPRDAAILVKRHGTLRAAARATGIPKSTLHDRARRAAPISKDPT